ICRETHEEAVAAARAMLPDDDTERQERGILQRSDSQALKQALAAADERGWMNSNLYAGLVPCYGSSSIALIGSPQELAERFIEFNEIKAHYDGVPAWRHDDIHMISVVGGLYGLNMIPLWRPKRITIFDINPAALTYFRLIRDVWTTSRDVTQFLARLTAGDYD